MRRYLLLTIFILSVGIGIICVSTSPTEKPTHYSLTALKSHSKSRYETVSLRPLPHAHTVVTPPTTTVSAPSTSVPAPVATPTTTTTSTVTTVVPVPTTAVSNDNASLLAEWTKVAVCEEGGWGNYGFPNYPDSLGINSSNWYGNGGGSDLSPAAQIAVAERVVAKYASPGWVPDQEGCAAW